MSALGKSISVLAFLVLVGIFGFEVWSAEQCRYTEDCGGYRRATQGAPNGKGEETLWERTTSDPIALYTFWLAIFTGGLALTSLVQWRYLRRADETARIAADAALETAKTASTQANHLSNSVAEAKRAADAMDNVAKAMAASATAAQTHLQAVVEDLRRSHRAWVGFAGRLETLTSLKFDESGARVLVSGVLKNVGSSPATAINVSANIIVAPSPPPDIRTFARYPAKQGIIATLGSILLPGDTLNILGRHECEVPVRLFRNAGSDEVTVWLGGDITYRDEFEEPHSSGFLFVFIAADGGNKVIISQGETRGSFEVAMAGWWAD